MIMNVKFRATHKAPEYQIDGEVITASYKDKDDTVDMSEFPNGAKYNDIESDLDLVNELIIFDVQRKEGELHVVLCQQYPSIGHWIESNWINADDYEKGKLYIKEVTNEG